MYHIGYDSLKILPKKHLERLQPHIRCSKIILKYQHPVKNNYKINIDNGDDDGSPRIEQQAEAEKLRSPMCGN